MQLPNYLRTYRKRSGLSQREVGFLLGARYGTHVSRYERFTRLPPLPSAIALGLVFHAPLNVLFAGTLRAAEQDTVRRIARLIRRLEAAAPSRVRDTKLAALRSAIDHK